MPYRTLPLLLTYTLCITLQMEVAESDTSTGSRNPSPSLPEGAGTVIGEGEPATDMEQEPSTSPNSKATTEPTSASTHNGESIVHVCERALKRGMHTFFNSG